MYSTSFHNPCWLGLLYACSCMLLLYCGERRNGLVSSVERSDLSVSSYFWNSSSAHALSCVGSQWNWSSETGDLERHGSSSHRHVRWGRWECDVPPQGMEWWRGSVLRRCDQSCAFPVVDLPLSVAARLKWHTYTLKPRYDHTIVDLSSFSMHIAKYACKRYQNLCSMYMGLYYQMRLSW